MSRAGSEKLYRVLRFLAVLAAATIPFSLVFPFLGLGMSFLLDAAGLPDKVKVAALILAALVFYALTAEAGRRLLIRRDAPAEKAELSRWSSIGMWLTPGILPGLAGLFLIRHYGDDRLLWLFPAEIAAALILGAAFPFRKHANTTLFGVMGPVAALLIFLGGLFVLGRAGKPLEYTGDDAAAIPHLSAWQKQNYFPAGADKIQVSGTTSAFTWECQLAEADFMKYMKTSPFRFQKAEGGSSTAPVYEYVKRHRNGGVLVLRYSVPERKFRGDFSSH